MGQANEFKIEKNEQQQQQTQLWLPFYSPFTPPPSGDRIHNQITFFDWFFFIADFNKSNVPIKLVPMIRCRITPLASLCK